MFLHTNQSFEWVIFLKSNLSQAEEIKGNITRYLFM